MPQEFKLFAEIILLSCANDWDNAKLEWALHEVYIMEGKNSEGCLCGKFPIKEVCILLNKHNQKTAKVGNCCVKKFLNLPSNRIFQSVKRVRISDEKSLNEDALLYAYNKKWLNNWEYSFYMDTKNKRKLSPAQMMKRQEINQKILHNMKRKS